MRAFLALALFGLGTTAVYAEVRLQLGERKADLELTSCVSGSSYYLIDATGDGGSLSVAAQMKGDQPYTSIVYTFEEGGEDLRADVSTEPIPLDNGFRFSGVAKVSDGSQQDLTIEILNCG